MARGDAPYHNGLQKASSSSTTTQRPPPWQFKPNEYRPPGPPTSVVDVSMMSTSCTTQLSTVDAGTQPEVVDLYEYEEGSRTAFSRRSARAIERQLQVKKKLFVDCTIF